MPRKKTTKVVDAPVLDYRYDAKRKNIPPAGLAAQGRVHEAPRLSFAYDPHLPPILRFDPRGLADGLPELLGIAQTRALTVDETQLLAEALRHREPWLEWAGKREKTGFEIDPVALHIHERVSTQAILKVAARESVQRSLFADPQQEYREAIQFYQYDIDWANRMILGDSLQVMASLAHREGLAGKVKMIYMDPPYGIRFSSNFQPEIGKREVKDKESDLTREPEMVKAYRDTWMLGVHSYLAYLRDRLTLCRELLTDSGSIFVQIGDENLHRVRCVMDEVFGTENAVVTIVLKKKGATTPTDPVNDYILWYAKEKPQLKIHGLFENRSNPEDDPKFNTLIGSDGDNVRILQLDEAKIKQRTVAGYQFARVNYPIVSQHLSSTRSDDFVWKGKAYSCGINAQWRFDSKTDLPRLASAGRLFDGGGKSLGGVVMWSDWPYVALTNIWNDLHGDQEPIYVAQTNRKAIMRCLLMTTGPGDLVLDPTCGSGTTAYVAEQWGRRWITIDTSRVALALARQRLLTATFPFYKVKEVEVDTQTHPEVDQPHNLAPTDQSTNPSQGFIYKAVPHITLKSIAQNVALDAIFAKHQPILDEKLARLNAALRMVTAHMCPLKLLP
jgi:adenine-specific DNA-methyltransferase